MEKIGFFIIVCCLSLILLGGCSLGGTLDTMEPTVSVPIVKTTIEDGSSNTMPTAEPVTPSAEKNIEPIKPQLEITPATITVEEVLVSPESSNSTPSFSAIDSLVQVAIQDLASRLDIPIDQVKLLEFREVVWPDASMGCPQPGMAYVQVPQDGLLIRLGVDKKMYFYHSGGSQDPFLCEETTQIIPQIIPKEDEFVPPPDSEID